eukprot:3699476-Rhodomonas_salina.9
MNKTAHAVLSQRFRQYSVEDGGAGGGGHTKSKGPSGTQMNMRKVSTGYWRSECVGRARTTHEDSNGDGVACA